ncbi:hypothetical protein FB45DRAFT_935695 [Roridomyces roridus]|uniref:Enoyl reductase (ER) domain-containing protein n=1 Tax=Roridomyces roridus TaxID=1738132 RepID=A0AAD7FEF9_9AGAR|nr:hypothetical protein FB45DRAFT_935695 [Roridomyces roridus]
MAPIRNARVLFNSHPEGYPVPGETTVYDATPTIDVDNVPLNGGFLVKTLVVSVDPYFRGRMRKPDPKSYAAYAAGFALGEPLYGYGIAKVLRSETPDVEVGKYIYGPNIMHQEYTVYPGLGTTLRLIEKHPDLPWTAYVGAAGMPGKTAWFAWQEFSDAKAGQIAFVTTGAGPVGSMVIQLAKAAGMKVIASAGSEEKVQFMKSIGVDVPFNYKTTDTREVLAKEGPIDIFWDNVGGEILDAALEFSAVYGRFILCGSIAGYNQPHVPIKNTPLIAVRSLHLHGILVFRLEHKYDKAFYATIPEKLASGEIKYSEEVVRGLEGVGDLILRVQKGENKAKAVVVVADE